MNGGGIGTEGSSRTRPLRVVMAFNSPFGLATVLLLGRDPVPDEETHPRKTDFYPDCYFGCFLDSGFDKAELGCFDFDCFGMILILINPGLVEIIVFVFRTIAKQIAVTLRALLFRWVWRFVSQDNSLWCRVISSIHGSCFPQSSPQSSSVWCSIVREIHKLKLQGVDLLSYVRVRVGNGLKTKFWKDPWIDDSLLCHRFPRVYNLEDNRDASVAEKLTASIDGSFRRSTRGGVEEQQFVQLQNLVDPCVLSSVSDRWVWSLGGDGLFRVKDVRNLLDDNFLPKSNNATRWVKFIPIKVNVFAKLKASQPLMLLGPKVLQSKPLIRVWRDFGDGE
ncbi:hypothetical protein Tco_0894611 [Tanacetum coccineum]|uniref:Uncharacterized protein n=1 Tax=Tanacetum coccineum TaxID=301880 RepID=A0ABQ5CIJ4_9ASTR